MHYYREYFPFGDYLRAGITKTSYLALIAGIIRLGYYSREGLFRGNTVIQNFVTKSKMNGFSEKSYYLVFFNNKYLVTPIWICCSYSGWANQNVNKICRLLNDIFLLNFTFRTFWIKKLTLSTTLIIVISSSEVVSVWFLDLWSSIVWFWLRILFWIFIWKIEKCF